MVGPGEIFTLFFVTLGPLKVLGPFAQQTRAFDSKAIPGIALRVFLLSLVALLAGGYVGRSLALNWAVSTPALLIATSLIFLLVALRLVLEQYEPEPAEPPAALPVQPMAAALKLTFPMVVTPYGVAALIALLAATSDSVRIELILGIAAGMMVLNLIAMLGARALAQNALLMLFLRLLGAVLGVLQVALAVQIMLAALRDLGVITG